ncbi:MAG: DUF58 domain-containing protein [Planctomycetes bacterium]|nr:DUF58 domain-containing protein [Planctomycetota bacterium]
MVSRQDKKRERVAVRRGGPVRLRLTLAGWLVLGVTTVIGVASAKSQAPFLFVLFGSVVGALLVSSMLSRRMLSVITVERELPDRAWQNQMVHMGYFLRNSGRFGSCLAVSVNELAPEGIQSAGGFCANLPARMTFRSGGRFVARRRGRIKLRGARLSTIFPFGLVAASRAIQDQASLVVWPAKGRLTRQILRRGAIELSHTAPSRDRGGQDEFFGLRDYRIGDNPRWIHWRRSAGRIVPVLREMSRTAPEILWIIFDTQLADNSNVSLLRLEKMIRFAATLTDYALTRGYQVGLALAHADGPLILSPSAGKGPRCRLLDALADVGRNAEYSLTDVLDRLSRPALARSQAVVLAADRSRLDKDDIFSLASASRDLTVIDGDELDQYFKDNPLCGVVPAAQGGSKSDSRKAPAGAAATGGA